MLHTVVAAMGKLIWIGDPHFLMQTSAPDSVLRAFLNQMLQMQVPWTAFPFHLLQTQPAADAGVSFFLQTPAMWDQIFADLATAEHRIIWNWPSVNVNEVLTGDLLSKSLATRAAVVIAGPVIPGNRASLESRQIRVAESAADDWLLLIDEEIAWYVGWNDRDQCIRPSVRVKGRKASLQIAELCGLNDLIPPRAKSS